ncbi:MAG: hemerythrin domain-containing protein [Thermoplasmataceae archaeon]
MDNLKFKGSNATQMLRDQHKITVGISEGFIANEVKVGDFVGHVDYTISVHFRLEEDVLFPILSPLLRQYLEFEEPIRIIRGEHVSIKSLYNTLYRSISFETEDSSTTSEEILNKSGLIAKTLLQHIFKEENGLFGMADLYIPEPQREKIQVDLEKKNEEYHQTYVSTHAREK